VSEENDFRVEGGLFLKKVWGFRPREAPVVGFGKAAGRSKFLAQSNATDQWIVLAATNTEFPDEEDKGRLLGLAKVYRQEVDTYQIWQEAGFPAQPAHFNEDGGFKWPYGLVIREARMFPDKPLLKDTLGTAFGIHEANFAVPLSEEHADIIRRLSSEAVPVKPVESLLDGTYMEQAIAYNAAHNNTSTGPVPSYQRSAVEIDSSRPGYAYRLQLIQKKTSRWERPVFKIGRSHAPEQRCAELNSGLVSAITGCHWEIADTFMFENEQLAHNFEQLMHQATSRWRVLGENEIVQMDVRELQNLWQKVLTDGKWLQSLETQR
jgi:hypothetical protein